RQPPSMAAGAGVRRFHRRIPAADWGATHSPRAARVRTRLHGGCGVNNDLSVDTWASFLCSFRTGPRITAELLGILRDVRRSTHFFTCLHNTSCVVCLLRALPVENL